MCVKTCNDCSLPRGKQFCTSFAFLACVACITNAFLENINVNFYAIICIIIPKKMVILFLVLSVYLYL